MNKPDTFRPLTLKNVYVQLLKYLLTISHAGWLVMYIWWIDLEKYDGRVLESQLQRRLLVSWRASGSYSKNKMKKEIKNSSPILHCNLQHSKKYLQQRCQRLLIIRSKSKTSLSCTWWKDSQSSSPIEVILLFRKSKVGNRVGGEPEGGFGESFAEGDWATIGGSSKEWCRALSPLSTQFNFGDHVVRRGEGPWGLFVSNGGGALVTVIPEVLETAPVDALWREAPNLTPSVSTATTVVLSPHDSERLLRWKVFGAFGEHAGLEVCLVEDNGDACPRFFGREGGLGTWTETSPSMVSHVLSDTFSTTNFSDGIWKKMMTLMICTFTPVRWVPKKFHSFVLGVWPLTVISALFE